MEVLLHLKLNLKITVAVFKLFAVEDFVMGENYIHPCCQSFSFKRVKGPKRSAEVYPNIT